MKSIVFLLISTAISLTLSSCNSMSESEISADFSESISFSSDSSNSSSSSSLSTSFPVAADDFYFMLTWGVRLDSSYDSRTGTLIKTKYVRERQPEEYIATYQYPNINEVYEMAKSISIYSYPDDYYPYEGCSMRTSPSVDYVFEINDKTITSENCPFSSGIPDDVTERGKQYLSLIFTITNVLINSDEWKAMPDPEVLYL